MKRLPVKHLMALMVIAALLISSISISFADDVLRIGVFPRRSVVATEKMFTPLASYLEQQLNQKVLLDVPADMPAFWSRVEQGRYDLVHLNQYHYVRAHAKLGWQAILKNEEFGKDTIAAAIWVLKGSDIKKISDLRGKLIVFGGGDHAMVSSIMTRDILLQAGLSDDDYIGMTTLHPVKSIISVYYNQADAAGTGEPVPRFPAIKKKIDVGKLRILAKSKALAQLPWAIRSVVSADEKDKITKALLSLNDSRAGKEILKSAGLTGIQQASDADYDEHREIIKRILDEQY